MDFCVPGPEAKGRFPARSATQRQTVDRGGRERRLQGMQRDRPVSVQCLWWDRRSRCGDKRRRGLLAAILARVLIFSPVIDLDQGGVGGAW